MTFSLGSGESSKGATAETMSTSTVTKPITAPIEIAGHHTGAMSVISDNTQTSTETGSTEVVQTTQQVSYIIDIRHLWLYIIAIVIVSV